MPCSGTQGHALSLEDNLRHALRPWLHLLLCACSCRYLQLPFYWADAGSKCSTGGVFSGHPRIMRWATSHCPSSCCCSSSSFLPSSHLESAHPPPYPHQPRFFYS
jgi:hypothetical protein